MSNKESSGNVRPTLRCSENSNKNTGNTRRYQMAEDPNHGKTEDRDDDASHGHFTVLLPLHPTPIAPMTEEHVAAPAPAMHPDCATTLWSSALDRSQHSLTLVVEPTSRKTRLGEGVQGNAQHQTLYQLSINKLHRLFGCFKTMCATLKQLEVASQSPKKQATRR